MTFCFNGYDSRIVTIWYVKFVLCIYVDVWTVMRNVSLLRCARLKVTVKQIFYFDALKAYGRVEEQFHSFLTSTVNGVSGQLHTPATLRVICGVDIMYTSLTTDSNYSSYWNLTTNALTIWSKYFA